MERILITGGAGFIGSNLCEYFVNNDYDVICLDNLSTGYFKNIETLTKFKNFQFVNADIRNIDECSKHFKNIDFVLHQAALGSVPRSIEDPITTNDVNISGFLNMLVLSKEYNIKRFIFAGSSSTYGDSKILPKEESIIGSPLSPYATTKYVNELYAKNFKTLYDLDFICFRYFNVFGKKQNPNGAYAAVIPKFISSILNLEQPVINGNGEYSRDFTHINNIIQINKLAVKTKNKKSLNQIYNAAYGNQTSIIDLFNKIKIELGKKDEKYLNVNPIFGPERIGDIPHSLANIYKAKNLLKYNPITNPILGLESTVDWFYNNYKK